MKKKYKLSRVARARISAAMTGRKLSDETRAKMSAAKKGIPFTEIHKKRIAKAHRGLKASAATIAILRAAQQLRRAKEREADGGAL